KDIATPLSAIIRKNRNQAADELKAIIKEWQPDALVVGIPLGGSSEDEMRRRVEHFLGLVEFGGEILFQDEANSSLEAEDLMRGEMKNVRDGRLDSIAAMIILQRFLATRT
ncbi:MAG: Holliday junction resolvase RuvX, partial [Epsilonproteobacteria bacterium]|nr:Holliday junction resolvase RuvX [Campylobacterota bacterium]